MTLETGGYALGKGEGEGIWFLNTLMVVKAGCENTRGGLTVIEAHLPPGFAPPPHLHHREDEGFYLLDGQMHVQCGDKAWVVGPGDFALLPRGIPHSLTVSLEHNVKMLQLSWPGQFERFAGEVGERATYLALPEPKEPNLDKLVTAAAEYGIELLPPPSA